MSLLPYSTELSLLLHFGRETAMPKKKRELPLLHARPSKNSFLSSKEDLEETLLFLLNQIDRLQKTEAKQKGEEYGLLGRVRRGRWHLF